MTQVMTDLDALAQVSQLVEDGKIRDAKRAAAELLDVIDPRTAALIAKCVSIQETYPNIAIAKLRALWFASNEHDRRVIEACAPKNGERRRAASPDQPAPRWTGRNNYQAPRNERRYNDPKARRATHPEQKRTGRPIGVAQDVADMYQDERAGVNEGPRPGGDNVYASGFDYDDTAVADLHGLPCAVCLTERSTNDCDLRHDDGLCVECRDGHTGIPPVHGGIKRSQFIMDRCTVIAANHSAQAAVTLVRQWWKKSTANRYDRPVIADWIADNPALTQEAAAEQATAVRVAARQAAWLAAEQDAQEAQETAAAERVAEEAEAAEYAAQYTARLADEAAEQATAVRVAARQAAWLAAEQDAAEDPEEARAIEAEFGVQETRAAAAAQAAAEPAAQEIKAEDAEAAENAAQCPAQLAAKEAWAAWLAAEQAAQEAQATAAAKQAAAEQAAQEAEAAAAAQQVAQAASASAAAVWLAAEHAAVIEQAAAQPLADCELCYNGRRLRDVRNLPADDGLCRDCRTLDSQTATKIAA